MSEKSTSGTDSSRRKFLKSAGKLAVYTPPIMLAMSSPSFAHIAKSGGSDCQTSYDNFQKSFGTFGTKYTTFFSRFWH